MSTGHPNSLPQIRYCQRAGPGQNGRCTECVADNLVSPQRLGRPAAVECAFRA